MVDGSHAERRVDRELVGPSHGTHEAVELFTKFRSNYIQTDPLPHQTDLSVVFEQQGSFVCLCWNLSGRRVQTNSYSIRRPVSVSPSQRKDLRKTSESNAGLVETQTATFYQKNT